MPVTKEHVADRCVFPKDGKEPIGLLHIARLKTRHMQIRRRMVHSNHDWSAGGTEKLVLQPFKPATVKTTEMADVVLCVEQDDEPVVQVDSRLNESFPAEYASKCAAVIVVADRQMDREPDLRQDLAQECVSGWIACISKIAGNKDELGICVYARDMVQGVAQSLRRIDAVKRLARGNKMRIRNMNDFLHCSTLRLGPTLGGSGTRDRCCVRPLDCRRCGDHLFQASDSEP